MTPRWTITQGYSWKQYTASYYNNLITENLAAIAQIIANPSENGLKDHSSISQLRVEISHFQKMASAPYQAPIQQGESTYVTDYKAAYAAKVAGKSRDY